MKTKDLSEMEATAEVTVNDANSTDSFKTSAGALLRALGSMGDNEETPVWIEQGNLVPCPTALYRSLQAKLD